MNQQILGRRRNGVVVDDVLLNGPQRLPGDADVAAVGRVVVALKPVGTRGAGCQQQERRYHYGN